MLTSLSIGILHIFSRTAPFDKSSLISESSRRGSLSSHLRQSEVVLDQLAFFSSLTQYMILCCR